MLQLKEQTIKLGELKEYLINMVGRPRKKDYKSKSFSLYEKTWLILKELEHINLQTTVKNKPLKEIAHVAIEEYYNKEKKKLGKKGGIK